MKKYSCWLLVMLVLMSVSCSKNAQEHHQTRIKLQQGITTLLAPYQKGQMPQIKQWLSDFDKAPNIVR